MKYNYENFHKLYNQKNSLTENCNAMGITAPTFRLHLKKYKETDRRIEWCNTERLAFKKYLLDVVGLSDDDLFDIVYDATAGAS